MTQDNPQTQTKLMICGSRSATAAMLDYAARVANRAYHNDWLIYTGDAVGIDKEVVLAFSKLPAIDFMHTSVLVVTGITPQPRLGFISYDTSEYVHLPVSGHTAKERYTKRDRYLVKNSDKVMCIWNGQSKSSGTYLNYLYACELGKTAWLVNSEGRIIDSNE